MDKAKRIMLVSPEAVKSGSYVNLNVDDSVVGAAIREGQQIHLQSVIGSNLLHRLQQLVLNAKEDADDNIDAEQNWVYKELLDDYVTPYLVNKVQALICVPVSLKIRNLGVVRTNDTNIDGPSLRDIMALQTRYNGMAAKYATYLSKYLCAHRAELPELNETDCGCGVFVPPVIGKVFVETGLVLGDTKSGCECA